MTNVTNQATDGKLARVQHFPDGGEIVPPVLTSAETIRLLRLDEQVLAMVRQAVSPVPNPHHECDR